MLSGIFPDNLKLAIVKPIFKKDDKAKIDNYRPITLIPILSKIYEKVMHAKLTSFFNKYHILNERQYGFQKNKSTSHAIFDLVRETMFGLNEKSYTTALFFDMSKAFDFVCHDLLLKKLEHCGVRGVVLKWIKTYLQNRKQSVEISQIDKNKVVQTYKSQFKENRFGVPQGSVLGPLLFLVYINDLPDVTEHQCILFADDISVVVRTDGKLTIENHKNDIEKTVKSIILWLRNNNLTINIKKTCFINFNNNISQTLNIYYQGQLLINTKTTKFLGIEIDNRLDWKKQVEIICNKVNSFTFAIYKLTRIASRSTALTAYFAYIESVLRYGLIMWGNSTEVEKAFIAQKKCVRAICGTAPDEPCKPLFKHLKILPLPCLYILEVSKFVKLNMKFFKQAKDIYPRNTRNSNRLVSVVIPKSVMFQRNCYWMCIQIYNKLPERIKQLPFNKFKTDLYTWLCDKMFYTVKE